MFDGGLPNDRHGGSCERPPKKMSVASANSILISPIDEFLARSPDSSPSVASFVVVFAISRSVILSSFPCRGVRPLLLSIFSIGSKCLRYPTHGMFVWLVMTPVVTRISPPNLSGRGSWAFFEVDYGIPVSGDVSYTVTRSCDLYHYALHAIGCRGASRLCQDGPNKTWK